MACQTVPVGAERFDPYEEAVPETEDVFVPIESKRTLDPKWLKPSDEPYEVGVGDYLEIEITGIFGSRGQTFVMPDGRIYYDLAGGVKVDGLTISEISDRLTEALSRDYASPNVNVTPNEVRSRRVWLLGRLSKSGLYL